MAIYLGSLSLKVDKPQTMNFLPMNQQTTNWFVWVFCGFFRQPKVVKKGDSPHRLFPLPTTPCHFGCRHLCLQSGLLPLWPTQLPLANACCDGIRRHGLPDDGPADQLLDRPIGREGRVAFPFFVWGTNKNGQILISSYSPGSLELTNMKGWIFNKSVIFNKYCNSFYIYPHV